MFARFGTRECSNGDRYRCLFADVISGGTGANMTLPPGAPTLNVESFRRSRWALVRRFAGY